MESQKNGDLVRIEISNEDMWGLDATLKRYIKAFRASIQGNIRSPEKVEARCESIVSSIREWIGLELDTPPFLMFYIFCLGASQILDESRVKGALDER